MGVVTLMLLAHLASTLFLVGMIWTVQIVHYPLMALVGEDRFVAYAASHSPRMAAVVMVPWSVQGITTVWLLIARPEGVALWLVAAAAAAAAVPVLVTIAASVPAHVVLGSGFDAEAHRRLVRTNWIRTVAWTTHAPIAAAILVRGG
jgi:hypothetical protein